MELSQATITGLWVSAVVVFVVGIGIYIGLQIYARYIRKKYVQKSQKQTQIQIQTLRNDIGTLPYILKDEFKSKADDLDIEGLINTFYINKYTSLLVISKNDLFPFACMVEKVKLAGYYDLDEFDFIKYNEVRRKLPDQFMQPVLPYNNENIDFVAVFNSDKNLNTLYENHYPNLNAKGMLAINLKKYKNSEILELDKKLKDKNIKHEVSYITNRFLFIVKNDIITDNLGVSNGQ
ncbi:BC85_0335 family putative methyltransferase [Mycoplasma sp. 4423]